jgi:hypothetical protein
VLVSNKVGVRQNFGLGGVALRPGPFGLKLRIPAVGVVDRQNVATRTWITIPIPRATNAVTGLDHDRVEPGITHPLQLVHPGKSCPNDRHVHICCALGHVGPFRYLLRAVSRHELAGKDVDRSRYRN